MYTCTYCIQRGAYYILYMTYPILHTAHTYIQTDVHIPTYIPTSCVHTHTHTHRHRERSTYYIFTHIYMHRCFYTDTWVREPGAWVPGKFKIKDKCAHTFHTDTSPNVRHAVVSPTWFCCGSVIDLLRAGRLNACFSAEYVALVVCHCMLQTSSIVLRSCTNAGGSHSGPCSIQKLLLCLAAALQKLLYAFSFQRCTQFWIPDPRPYELNRVSRPCELNSITSLLLPSRRSPKHRQPLKEPFEL